MSWKYEDMLHMDRPVGLTKMSRHDRAAQFAPFAALTGHDAVLRETARLTDGPVELTQSRREELDTQLRALADRLDCRPLIAVTHYVPDERKSGGAYVRTTGRLRKLDALAGALVFTDGSGIDLDGLFDIECLEEP